MQVRREGEELPGDFDEQVLIHALAFMLVARERQLDAGEQEERAEDRQQPGEALDGRDTGDDEERPHGDGADDAPEQDAVLEVVRDLEVGEDEDEDEQVIDREGQFQDVAGGEQLGVLRTAPSGQQEAKRDGQGDPDDAPRHRLLEGGLVVGLIEDPQVEGQHAHHEAEEGHPGPRWNHQSSIGEDGNGKDHALEVG